MTSGRFETAEGAGASGETPGTTLDIVRAGIKAVVIALPSTFVRRGEKVKVDAEKQGAAEVYLERSGRVDLIAASMN